MPHETESERVDRIRNAQIDARSSGKAMSSYSQSRLKKGANQQKPKVKPLVVELFQILPMWLQEILAGFAFGLIPAILVAVLLPGAFKWLSVVVLLLAGGAGYMLGGKTQTH